MSTCDRVEEIEGPYGPFAIGERAIQRLWASGEVRGPMPAASGATIEIVSPGDWNRGAGPDFLGAELRVEGRRVTIAGLVAESPSVVADGWSLTVDDGSGPLRVIVTSSALAASALLGARGKCRDQRARARDDLLGRRECVRLGLTCQHGITFRARPS